MVNILKENKKIIINTDIDGIFSGLILHNFLGCEIVGFSNSDNCVWIDTKKVKSIYDAVYIDMFVPNENVICIDQHIVSANANHHQRITNNIKKINPNLDNPRYFLPNNSYYIKYPFGTIHYIISILEKSGINVNIDLNRLISGDIKLIDLILRADDAMKTSVDSPYISNAKNWWEWLIQSSQSNTTKHFFEYLNRLTPRLVNTIKTQTTQLLLSNPFNCTSPDGGFKQILNSDGSLRENVKNYVKFIANSSNLNEIDTNLNLTAFIGRTNRISLNSQQIAELISNNSVNGEPIFSYAFVRSSNRDQSFSYTVM